MIALAVPLTTILGNIHGRFITILLDKCPLSVLLRSRRSYRRGGGKRWGRVGEGERGMGRQSPPFFFTLSGLLFPQTAHATQATFDCFLAKKNAKFRLKTLGMRKIYFSARARLILKKVGNAPISIVFPLQNTALLVTINRGQ